MVFIKKRVKFINKKMPSIVRFLPMLIVLLCLFLSVGYATVNEVLLNVQGEAVAMIPEGIFFNEIDYSNNNGADLTKSNINATTGTILKSSITLSETDSTSFVTYRVNLLNNNDFDVYYMGSTYDENFYDNTNIVFEISENLTQGMVIAPHENIDFTITFKYKNGVSPNENINQLNAYINFKFSYIPEDYILLEYVESSGTQYIDTGVLPNHETRIEIKASSTGPYSVYGSIGTYAFFNLTGTTLDGMYYYWGDQGYSTQTDFYNQIHVYEQDKNIAKVDGEVYYTYEYEQWSSNVPIALFARFDEYYNVNDIGGTVRIWYAHIYDNGNLVRYYIPTVSPSGEIGLYDLVNSKFYGNDGTGKFISPLPLGYQKLNYVESSGTQYINTGILPNQDTRIEIKASSTGPYSVYGSIQNEAHFNLTGGSNGMYYYWGDGGSTIVTNYFNEIHVFEQDKNVAKIDGEVYHTYDPDTWSSDIPIALFARFDAYNNINDIGGTVRIWYAKIYDNGTLVRDYIPVINSKGKVGLYDVENNKFYGNEGSGEFIAGIES